MSYIAAILGLVCFVSVAYALSNDRNAIDKKIIFWGLALQWILALLVLGIPALGVKGPLQFVFVGANNFVDAIIRSTSSGTQFLFDKELLNVSKMGFIFAIQVLPTIIFFSSLMAVLYYLGIMQKVVHVMAMVMHKLMKASGAESLSLAANIFVGQTEAPLVIRPYVHSMTRSELFTLMTGGMATVAGGVLIALVGMLESKIPGIAGHLLTASVMSAPAALVMAKIIYPESQTPATLGHVPKKSLEVEDVNIIEAAARGAGDGLKMALNVGAMLLAFIALIALLNMGFKYFGELVGFHQWGQQLVPELIRKPGEVAPLSVELVLGWIFAPVAWLMGVPWNEATVAGALLGQKMILNEFIAYGYLAEIAPQLSVKTNVILSYALCGFANFSSIAIQIGGIGELAPSRRSELALFGVKAMLGGTFAAFMTASIAGLLL